MTAADSHALGYRDVDGDRYTEVLVDNMGATSEWRATQQLRAWERQHLALESGERLLDVGCGRAEAGLTLAADLGPSGKLVGIDASEAMLDNARSRSDDVPCSARFSVGDACSLTEPAGSFDAVRSERTLQWLSDPMGAVREFRRVLRPGGRLSLIDTDWSTLSLDVGDDTITAMVGEGLRFERNRPSNVGRRLGELAAAAGFDVVATTSAEQTWTDWNPDGPPAPDGCFSMSSLAEDLVESGHLDQSAVSAFVGTVHEAARRGEFAMSLTMHALVARLP